jgi:hypothetical protein
MSPVRNLPPVVPTTRLAEVNDARAMSRSGNLLPQECLRPDAPGQRRKSNVPLWESTPSSAYDQTRRGQRRKGDVSVWESTPRECLRPDAPRLTAEGRCPGLAADGVWQLVPVPCADSPSGRAMTKWQLAIGMSTCLGRCTEFGWR